jgi:SMI1 / KNR4 family (SUKH-1)
MSHQQRIQRIVELLARVRGKGIDTFGASAHGFQLAPPLTEPEVDALERRHGIALPPDYRDFLKQAGASGAGPSYGLLPATRWGDALSGDVDTPDFAARGCPWQPGMTRDAATWARVGEELDEPFQGTIALCHQGCAYYAVLVVTGPARGRVMYVSPDGGCPLFMEDEGFLDWYQRWLDELDWGFQHHWFGTSMRGDEAAFAAAAAGGQERLAALGAMHQLPTLSASTRAVVAACIGDPDPALKAAALSLASAKELHDLVAVHAEACLRSEDAELRRAALVARVKGADWHDLARKALADPEPAVVVVAVRALADSGALDAGALLPLVEGDHATVAEAALRACCTIPSAALFDRVRAVEAPSLLRLQALLAQVRLDAVDAVGRAHVLDEVLAAIDGAEGPLAPGHAIRGLLAFPEDGRAFARLLELTRHPEPFFRFEAPPCSAHRGEPRPLSPSRRCRATMPCRVPRAGRRRGASAPMPSGPSTGSEEHNDVRRRAPGSVHSLRPLLRWHLVRVGGLAR